MLKFVKVHKLSNLKLRQSESSSEDRSILASLWQISSILSATNYIILYYSQRL